MIHSSGNICFMLGFDFRVIFGNGSIYDRLLVYLGNASRGLPLRSFDGGFEVILMLLV